MSNACGTIAMLHAILNNRDLLGIEGKECTLDKFYTETKNLSAEERGRALDDSADIGSVHNGLVAEGQSQQVEGEQTALLNTLFSDFGCHSVFDLTPQALELDWFKSDYHSSLDHCCR